MKNLNKLPSYYSSENNLLSENEIADVVEKLCDPDSYSSVYHRTNHDFPMPSSDDLSIGVELIKSIIFPGYFIHSEVRPETMKYYIGSSIDKVFRLLSEQVKRGFCFSCFEEEQERCEDCDERSKLISKKFLSTLPNIRFMLSLDAKAAYTGDPAAKGLGESISCPYLKHHHLILG